MFSFSSGSCIIGRHVVSPVPFVIWLYIIFGEISSIESCSSTIDRDPLHELLRDRDSLQVPLLLMRSSQLNMTTDSSFLLSLLPLSVLFFIELGALFLDLSLYVLMLNGNSISWSSWSLSSLTSPQFELFSLSKIVSALFLFLKSKKIRSVSSWFSWLLIISYFLSSSWLSVSVIILAFEDYLLNVPVLYVVRLVILLRKKLFLKPSSILNSSADACFFNKPRFVDDWRTSRSWLANLYLLNSLSLVYKFLLVLFWDNLSLKNYEIELFVGVVCLFLSCLVSSKFLLRADLGWFIPCSMTMNEDNISWLD